MFTTDHFMDRRMKGDAYNCAHFAEEVWLALTGECLSDRAGHLLRTGVQPDLRASEVSKFEKLPAPVDPSLVVMRRRGASPHVGVYTRGKVLHLQHSGVEFMELEVATRGFSKVSFYA
jgi:hypothetical protein